MKCVRPAGRKSVTIPLNGAEYLELDAKSSEAGLSLPAYVRTRCGFEVRNTSLPNTPERVQEEDDAWDRLRRLGLEPQGFFPWDE